MELRIYTDVYPSGERSEYSKAILEKLGEARKRGWKEGYNKGFADAKTRYLVSYCCNICGERIEVTSKEEKSSIREYMKEKRWAHTECLESR